MGTGPVVFGTTALPIRLTFRIVVILHREGLEPPHLLERQFYRLPVFANRRPVHVFESGQSSVASVQIQEFSRLTTDKLRPTTV